MEWGHVSVHTTIYMLVDELYVGGCQWQWQVFVSDEMVSVCMTVSVCVCVSITVSFLLLTFKLSSGCLFSPHHVSQGGVQKATPHLYGSHTDGKSLRRHRTDWHCLVMRNQNPNSRRRTTVRHLERLPNMHTFLVYIQPTLREQSSCIVIF